MKRLVLSCVLVLLTVSVGFAQDGGQVLIQYSALASDSTASDTTSGVTFTANGVSGRGVTRVGLLPAPGDFFSSQGFSSDVFVEGDRYLEFSVTGSGLPFEVNRVKIQYTRSSTGPVALALRSSNDGFAADLRSDPDIDSFAGEFTVSDLVIQSSDTLTFRLYGFRAGDSAGTFSLDPITNDGPSGIIIRGTIDANLPVELTSFTATPAVAGARLEWDVASELNNDFFSVEVSRDAENFKEVDRLAGRGTTETQAAYAYDYKAYVSGTYYFRLKQVDFDGTETYSQVVPLEVRGRKGFQVLGNSSQSTLELEVEGQRDFRIVSLTGEVVQTVTAVSGLVTVDLSRLSSGMYLLTDGVTTTRFVRQ